MCIHVLEVFIISHISNDVVYTTDSYKLTMLIGIYCTETEAKTVTDAYIYMYIQYMYSKTLCLIDQ